MNTVDENAAVGRAGEPLPLSVAVITLNERDNLPRCLDSVAPLAGEIVVVDSGSTDGTVELATNYGARVLHRDWPGHVAQKNRALEACSEPWVLCLDADEPLSSELAENLRDLFSRGDPPLDGYLVNRRTFYLGDWIRHAWYPEWRLRLVRRSASPRWQGRDPHDFLTVQGRTARLRGDLLHYSYRDLEDHFTRTVRYARIGADELVRQGRPFRWYKLLLSPWARLVRSLVIKQSWRDGWRGVIIAGSSMFAAFLKYAFVLEAELASRRRRKEE